MRFFGVAMTRALPSSYRTGGTRAKAIAVRPTKERNFVGHIIKVHRHEKDSTKEWKWSYVLLQLQSGTKVLVELRYVKRSYYLRMGDKVSVVTKNAVPAHRLPCLYVPDEFLEMVETGTVGCTCCPEVYGHARFEFLTELNPEIPIVMNEEYQRLMNDHGPKRQMTFKMLVDEVALRKGERWYAFVSAIIKVHLCKMFDENKLFCARCECGNVVTANRRGIARGSVDNCMACKKRVDLRLNPQILAGLADETGGFFNDGRHEDDHAVLLSGLAWSKLLSTDYDLHHTLLNRTAVQPSFRSEIELVEQRMLYTRQTFAFCWTGTWAGGRFVIVDML